jgi:hypothetical protein
LISDFSRYLGLLRVKWPLVIPAVLTAGLAVLSVILGRSGPLVLPGAVWLVLAAVMLSISQFLVWRDSEAVPVTPEHMQQIRAVGRELFKQAASSTPSTRPVYGDGRTQLPILEEAFQAHYPSQARQIEGWRRDQGRYRECWDALETQIRQEVADRFPAERGWSPDSIAAQACNRRADLLSDPEKSSDAYFKNYGAEKEVLGLKSVSPWGGDSEPVREWARDFFVSPAATGVLDARADLDASRAAAAESLEPIIKVDGVPLQRERCCPICFSPAR